MSAFTEAVVGEPFDFLDSILVAVLCLAVGFFWGHVSAADDDPAQQEQPVLHVVPV